MKFAVLPILSACVVALIPIHATAAPLKAVVFAVEGVDLARGASTEQRLAAATDLLRKQVASAGLAVVDIGPQASKIAESLPLRDCNGCDEDIAKALGGDVEIATAVRQASSAIYELSGSIKDVRGGRVIRQGSVEVHGESPDEWAHAVKFLLKERLLNPPLPGDAAALAGDGKH